MKWVRGSYSPHSLGAILLAYGLPQGFCVASAIPVFTFCMLAYNSQYALEDFGAEYMLNSPEIGRMAI